MFHYAKPGDLGKLHTQSPTIVKNKESFYYHTPTTVIQHLNKLIRVSIKLGSHYYNSSQLCGIISNTHSATS